MSVAASFNKPLNRTVAVARHRSLLRPPPGADTLPEHRAAQATGLGMPMLTQLDLQGFWKASEYATKTYVDVPLTPELLARVEQALGYKLPVAYVELMKLQNGGIPVRTRHRTSERTTWAKDHIAITGIFGIGETKPYSLRGEMGSEFWMEEWGYPEIGVYFADCPSAGHHMLCLDYRECGPHGEPRVVHVDQEWDYKITIVAPSFEAFIRGLEGGDAFQVG